MRKCAQSYAVTASVHLYFVGSRGLSERWWELASSISYAPASSESSTGTTLGAPSFSRDAAPRFVTLAGPYPLCASFIVSRAVQIVPESLWFVGLAVAQTHQITPSPPRTTDESRKKARCTLVCMCTSHAVVLGE